MDLDTKKEIARSYDLWFNIEKANRLKVEKSLQLQLKNISESDKLTPEVMESGDTVAEDAH